MGHEYIRLVSNSSPLGPYGSHMGYIGGNHFITCNNSIDTKPNALRHHNRSKTAHNKAIENKYMHLPFKISRT